MTVRRPEPGPPRTCRAPGCDRTTTGPPSLGIYCCYRCVCRARPASGDSPPVPGHSTRCRWVPAAPAPGPDGAA